MHFPFNIEQEVHSFCLADWLAYDEASFPRIFIQDENHRFLWKLID